MSHGWLQLCRFEFLTMKVVNHCTSIWVGEPGNGARSTLPLLQDKPWPSAQAVEPRLSQSPIKKHCCGLKNTRAAVAPRFHASTGREDTGLSSPFPGPPSPLAALPLYFAYNFTSEPDLPRGVVESSALRCSGRACGDTQAAGNNNYFRASVSSLQRAASAPGFPMDSRGLSHPRLLAVVSCLPERERGFARGDPGRTLERKKLTRLPP